jgi:hypothetical protein
MRAYSESVRRHGIAGVEVSTLRLLCLFLVPGSIALRKNQLTEAW